MNVIVEGEGMIASQTSPNQPPRSPSNMSNFSTGVRRYHEKWAKKALALLSKDKTKLSMLKTSGDFYENKEL